MIKNKKNKKIILRIIVWLFYLLSGFFFYKKNLFPESMRSFCRLLYPLSIFWLQIRLKNQEPWLPFTESMSTSQLWFKFLPVIASISTFILVTINMILNLVIIFFK